jgi:hypothetical protein
LLTGSRFTDVSELADRDKAALRMPANEALHDIQLLERIATVRAHMVGVILTCPLLKVVQCIPVKHRVNGFDLQCERKCPNRSRSLFLRGYLENSGYIMSRSYFSSAMAVFRFS